MPIILKSYRELKAYLGRQDSFVSLHEIAFRELVSSAENHPVSAREFFIEINVKHGIHVNFPDARNIREGIGRIYVLMTVGALERFLHEFDDERAVITAKRLFEEGWSLDDCIQVIGRAGKMNANIQNLISLVRYYKVVRDAAGHPFATKQHTAELKARLDQIRSEDMRTFVASRYSEEIRPQELDRLDFGDFILCSRVVKDFALQVARLFSPGIDQIPATQNWGKKFAKLKDARSERRRNAYRNDLQTTFGLDPAEADSILDSLGGF